MVAYDAKFEPDREGGFVIRFPDLPNATTQADSMDDACEMATDALRTLFLGLMRLGEALPAPGKVHRGRHFTRITLPALESAKIELYRTWRARGMRKSQLAAGMGIPRSHVGSPLRFEPLAAQPDRNSLPRAGQDALRRRQGRRLVAPTSRAARLRAPLLARRQSARRGGIAASALPDSRHALARRRSGTIHQRLLLLSRFRSPLPVSDSTSQ